jgi:hypothetical protein
VTQAALMTLGKVEAQHVPLGQIMTPKTYGATSGAAKAMGLLGQTSTVLLRRIPGYPVSATFEYEVVDGARRVTEAVARGDETILAIIQETDDYHASLSTLGMNLSANDNHIGQAQALRRALVSKTLEQVSYDSGISLTKLKPVAAIAELPDDVLALSGIRIAPTLLVKISKLPQKPKLRAVAMLREMTDKQKFGEKELAICKAVQSIDFSMMIDGAINSTQGAVFDPLDTATAQVRSMAKAQGVSLKELAQKLLEEES